MSSKINKWIYGGRSSSPVVDAAVISEMRQTLKNTMIENFLYDVDELRFAPVFVNVEGPPGRDGRDGINGQNGHNGNNGDNGHNGNNGDNGHNGNNGDNGHNGNNGDDKDEKPTVVTSEDTKPHVVTSEDTKPDVDTGAPANNYFKYDKRLF